MEARLTDINRNEVLHYLGYKGGEIPADVDAGIDRCIDMMLAIARPRLVYRIFDLSADRSLAGAESLIKGKNARELLKECSQAVIFGVTLGHEADAAVRKAQIKNMTEALILDCCGSSAIENVCDNFCKDLQDQITPKFLTDRFSPGYGDMPVSQQKEFVNILDMPRRIGVSLSSGGLMIPQKSVTAFAGIADTPQKKRFRGCAYCGSFRNCEYRRGNNNCGRS